MGFEVFLLRSKILRKFWEDFLNFFNIEYCHVRFFCCEICWNTFSKKVWRKICEINLCFKIWILEDYFSKFKRNFLIKWNFIFEYERKLFKLIFLFEFFFNFRITFLFVLVISNICQSIKLLYEILFIFLFFQFLR